MLESCDALYQGGMVTAEDARGWTALHHACRTLAKSERSASSTAKEDLRLIREQGEEASVFGIIFA